MKVILTNHKLNARPNEIPESNNSVQLKEIFAKNIILSMWIK